MAQLKDLIVNGPSRFIGDVYATTFTGNLEGNANTATNATNAGMIAGLSVHSGRNNEANKIVRTDGNGYLQVGYINSSSGHEKNASNPTYVWGSNSSDSYLRSYQTSSLSVNYATTSGSCSGNAASSTQSLLLSNTSDAKAVIGVYFHRDFNVKSLVGNTDGNGTWGHPGDSQDARYGNASILRIGWDSKYYTDIFTGPNGADGKYGLQWRQIVNNGVNNWRTLLDSSNYNYYALPLSGGTMANTNVVTNLNADLLDGLHASSFSLAEHTHSQYLTSALIPAKLARKETYPPGYFIIKINNNNSEWMLSFDVKIVVTDGSYTIRFSEDNRSMSKSWSSPSASMIDGEDSVEVKFGYSQTNKWVAILIPESYVGISITNVANGYAPIDTYALNKLFSIDFYMDDVLQYLGTVQKTITIYPPSKEGHTHTFASLTDKPTTISGYGITDALTTSNYNSYAPKLDGTGATGTWGISISGNAATADNLAKTFIENINYAARTTGLKLIRYDDNWEANGFPEKWTSGLSVMAGYCGWQLVTFGGNSDTPYFRKVSDSGVWSNWRALAFTDSNISGNAATATNADKLDGYHKTDILRRTSAPTSVISLNNVVTEGIDFTSWAYAQSANVNNQPGGNGASSAASVVSFGTHYPFQIYSDYNNTSLLYYRSYYSETGWKVWRQFAFIDSNVASATKLANSRTIWGQSFDGTGNVIGFPSFPACININRNAQTGAILDPSKIGFEIETFANDARLKTYSASGGSNQYHLVLTSNGNVGIGTASPSYKLHIAGTAYASAGLVSDGPVKVNESFVVDGTNGS